MARLSPQMDDGVSVRWRYFWQSKNQAKRERMFCWNTKEHLSIDGLVVRWAVE